VVQEYKATVACTGQEPTLQPVVQKLDLRIIDQAQETKKRWLAALAAFQHAQIELQKADPSKLQSMVKERNRRQEELLGLSDEIRQINQNLQHLRSLPQWKSELVSIDQAQHTHSTLEQQCKEIEVKEALAYSQLQRAERRAQSELLKQPESVQQSQETLVRIPTYLLRPPKCSPEHFLPITRKGQSLPKEFVRTTCHQHLCSCSFSLYCLKNCAHHYHRILQAEKKLRRNRVLVLY